jgi:NAD(P)H-dependent FMN reductase
MSAPDPPLCFAVLLGSVRRERKGIRAARLIVRAVSARGHEPVLVDPMEKQLPLLDRMYKEFPKGEAPAVLEELAELYRRVDGFLIVSGEYNHGIPPALKNLLDYFLEEYFWRPSGIVSYSATHFGGVRAAIALRATLAELGMPSVSGTVAIPHIADALNEAGEPQDKAIGPRLDRFLDEFCWHARALRDARRHGTPY